MRALFPLAFVACASARGANLYGGIADRKRGGALPSRRRPSSKDCLILADAAPAAARHCTAVEIVSSCSAVH
jgi:hypothetical protein